MSTIRIRGVGLTIACLCSHLSSPAQAAPSTTRGQISVAQVVQMLEEAPRNAIAHQVLTAYLAGVGESAGVLVSLAAGKAACKTSLKLDDRTVRQALAPVAADAANAAQIPATPVILRDMLTRAGCRLE
ncbi:chlorophyllide reductase [Labrys sp. La1]|uniref:chlorophyllide reductase n=1 Tax=Labrys sp. La1 TaxID=3404917 RepID=UPI003EBFADD0